MDDAKRKSLGIEGENIACSYLQKKGYSILERNFRCRAGEIDIIASIGPEIVFVEVKTRRNTDFGEPYLSVNHRKQAKLQKTALYYISKMQNDGWDYRFDVISIVRTDTNISVEHVISAF